MQRKIEQGNKKGEEKEIRDCIGTTNMSILSQKLHLDQAPL
jgi:hypothetical protein